MSSKNTAASIATTTVVASRAAPAFDTPIKAGASAAKSDQPLPDAAAATAPGGVIVGEDPLAIVSRTPPRLPGDRVPGEATDSPADEPMIRRQEDDKADPLTPIECLVVTPAVDRRRAGRRFRKGQVERIPLSVLGRDARAMIEADPLLSTRVERV